jgi:two-component system, OmpR family, phosphate regulon sensor histidine kinase PhoR
MWRSRMFWQLFGTYGVLILLSVGLLGFVVGSQAERSELAEIEESLRIKAILLREAIRGHDIEGDREFIGRLNSLSGELPMRITFIAKNGQVVAESWRDPSELENHADRPEIQQATAYGFGKAVRHSVTVGQDMIYVALRTQPAAGGQADPAVAFIRVALPLAGIQAKVASLQRLIWSAAALTAFFALALAFWLAHRIAKPIRELTRGAEEIAAGAYGHRVYVEAGDEVGQLTKTFNHMSDRLASQFTQLDEDRQQLRTVLSSMVEGVVAVDAEQRVLFANERAGHLLEFAARNAVGRFLWELIRHRSIHEVIQSAMSRGEEQTQELTWNGPGTKSLVVHVARLPGPHSASFDKGNNRGQRGAVLVFHDNTELRRLERLRQEFVANVSHELKTPLAIIQACVETLIDGAMDDPPHRGKFLDRIADQATRLHNLILDLLRLARIESEIEVFTKEKLDLAVIVNECLEKHRTLAEGKKQRLEMAPDLKPAGAWANEEALRQILDNLVDNAIKYTPEGGHVRVRWAREGDKTLFEIKDTGIGIADVDLPRIFERFYRVDKARSRDLGGTGLGLAIVKHLAQAMHGHVQAHSSPGEGSTFTVYLPAVENVSLPEKLPIP